MQHAIMDLAELGMLYRTVYNFTQRKLAEAGVGSRWEGKDGKEASMVEQVCSLRLEG